MSEASASEPSDLAESLRPHALRRDAVDVARALALFVVVAGHLALAVIDRGPDDALRGDNLLGLFPDWAWLTVLAPMPVFFAAAGWANATATLDRVRARLRTLVGLATVVVGVWSVAVLGAVAATGEPGVLGDGARLATQPLWFLAAYLPFTAGGRALARLGASRPVLAVGGSLVALAVLDVVRFGLDGPGWIGWPGFYLAWGVPWLVGGWWRDRWTRGRLDERRAGALLAVAATTAAAALVAWGGYHGSLIDVGAGGRSNTTPPTLYTAVAGLAQVGVLLVLAGPLDRLGRRRRALWDRAGTVAVGVYVWHLTALALCIGLVALGAPTPTRLTAAWWALRPVWWALVLAGCAGLVALSALGTSRATRARRDRPPPGRAQAWSGIVAATAGAVAVGLRGPGTVTRAALCCGLLGAGWWLLGPRPGRRRHPEP